MIFDRTGKKVYNRVGYQSDWNGDGLPSGVYYYILRVPVVNEEYQGNVTIFEVADFIKYIFSFHCS